MVQTASSKKPPDAQIKRFQELARSLECDEDEEAFKRSLRKVAKAKPTQGETK